MDDTIHLNTRKATCDLVRVYFSTPARQHLKVKDMVRAHALPASCQIRAALSAAALMISVSFGRRSGNA